MRKVILLVMFISFAITCCVYAELPQPRISPTQGQTKEQQDKDARECEEIAIKESGVDPVVLNMKYRSLESMYSMKTMPRSTSSMPSRGGRQTTDVLSPSRNNEAQEYKKQMTEIEKQYKKYKDAFAAKIKERGYEVKWK